MAKLRNLPQICPVPMESLIKSKKNQIVSMALSDSDHVQVSLFTFADKETVSEEEYFGDTMYLVVEGEMNSKRAMCFAFLHTSYIQLEARVPLRYCR